MRKGLDGEVLRIVIVDLVVEGLQGGVLGIVTVEMGLGVRAAIVGQGVATMVVVALTKTSFRCGLI